METRAEAAATASASSSSPAIVALGSAAGSSSSAAAASSDPADAASALAGLKFVLNLPPGYHFAPTDAELVVNFLRPRLDNKPPPLPIFFDERILDYHPEQLIEKYRIYGEDRWFFFTRKERKHAGGKRPNRTTPGNGHWNATGSQRPIYSGGVLVGCVGTLVFYEASRKKKKEDATAAAGGADPASPDEDNNGKTDWTMYEYESLTSEAEFEAKRNGEGKIDELVLCTIQKKHCEQSEEKGKKKRKRKEDQEGTPRDGSGEKKGRGVGRKHKDQESSHDGGSPEEKSSPVNCTNKKGGSRTKGTNRKELAQEQEAFVKRFLMATPQQELMQARHGGETVNTDPNMKMSHCSVTTSTMLPFSSQEMMPVPAAGAQSNSVHPNYVMHQNIQSLEILLSQGPTLREHFPYEQTYYCSQHMQTNTTAPPEVYNSCLDPEYSYHEFGNTNHLLRIGMDYQDLQSFQFPAQPSYGIGGSTSTQGTFLRSPGNNSVDLKLKY